MNKRFIINESEKDSILKLHQEEKSKGNIFEQLEEYNFKRAVQCFLNKKGVKDDAGNSLVVDGSIGNYPNSKTAQAIFKYQDMIKVDQDGVWGYDTMSKMPQKDRNLFNECKSDEGDLFDKAMHWLGWD